MRGTSFLTVAFVGSLLCATPVRGQDASFDPSKTVVPLGGVKLSARYMGLAESIGTGFCLDERCKFIGTNYHVAINLGKSPRIRGEKAAKSYLGSAEDDEGATVMEAQDRKVSPMVYNVAHDFAIYELKTPLSNKGMSGVTFSLDELETGEEVDIYTFPPPNPIHVRRVLTKFSATFLGGTQAGLLAFNFEASETGQTIQGGMSGGLIIDRKTQRAVGVLVGVAKHDNVATAIPAQFVSGFVKRVAPSLYVEIFPDLVRGLLRPTQPLDDLYPRYVPEGTISTDPIPRIEESTDIRRLREKAQDLEESIKNFVAVQTLHFERTRVPRKTSEYEIRVIDGRQAFREYPGGKRELKHLPLPTGPVVDPGNEWLTLPAMVGTELNLKISQARGTVVMGQAVKVY